MAGYRRSIEAFEAEHRALPSGLAKAGPGAGNADRADEVDVRLIGSAIARARFELDGIESWRRDPWFYLDQTIGTVFDLLLRPPPVDEAAVRRAADASVHLAPPWPPPGRTAQATLPWSSWK